MTSRVRRWARDSPARRPHFLHSVTGSVEADAGTKGKEKEMRAVPNNLRAVDGAIRGMAVPLIRVCRRIIHENEKKNQSGGRRNVRNGTCGQGQARATLRLRR
ncbi:hypothetical protein MRX96_055235 [Rhipicephalus microplus]